VGSKGKKPGKGGTSASKAQTVPDASSSGTRAPKMKEKEYQELLRPLHGELVALQEWVKATGARVCIVFEGRDTAG